MKKFLLIILTDLILISTLSSQQNFLQESKADKDKRMQWWRDARFGMFIHFGLYAVPAGEWKGATNHAEWIRTSAQIPLEEYNKFVSQFNPVNFHAEDWVQMAKNAGMKYITITSKHHDGFCLWDSKETDFDMMSTPFHRDILKELADACRKTGGIKLCFYHSIMDWHHPDYNERRDWEKDRPVDGTDRKRYITYLKNELKELVTNYGDIGVIWFDGEWENFWTHEDGKELYNYVRSLKPGIIINNRVDKGRNDMAGMTTAGDFAGDFGTPEQEIPETGLPGEDWESCMTMNDNWGYNKADKNFKSVKELIQKLADIASKGGNFLLNIGPKADGTFPQESIDRLKAIGDWMKINGESIYGTSASPFEHTSWGRVTQKKMGEDTRLYLHVFNCPVNGKIQLAGIANKPLKVFGLSGKKNLTFHSKDNIITIQVPGIAAEAINTVIVVDIKGKPLVYKPPVITAYSTSFITTAEVTISFPDEEKGVTIRYTTDGSDPVITSPLYKEKLIFSKTTWLKAGSFSGNKPVSEMVERKFEKTEPAPDISIFKADPGLQISYYEGDWNELPDFRKLTAKENEIITIVSPGRYAGKERYGVTLDGYIQLQESDIYKFYLSSDDGSALYVDGGLAIDNNGLHGMTEKNTTLALAAGFHSIRVEFFEKTGGDDLKLFIESMKMKKQEVDETMLFH
jgi:alpha-L-fucosidase